ncbi:MAG: hypothetical protein K2N72_09775 [Oscillospiraceae bacterium]|nr:hypothetical protein [Oscillospiraceae bacterium]
MKKRGLSIGISIFFLLSGCSQNSAQNSARAVISESVFEVSETNVTGGVEQLTEQIRDVETFSGTALEEASGNGEISGFINAMEKLSGLGDGMLYDFDFDNIPEIVAFDYGMEDTFYSIFKYSGGEFLNLGEMKSCNECLFTNNSAHIDLYHDNKSGEFFYCASSVDFVKNNSEEAGVYGFNGGNLYRYEFTENEMTKSVMVSLWENSDDEEALEAYLQDCENALSQFEMIGSAVFEPLWTGADIRDGTYRDIVRYELENRYGFGGNGNEKNDGLYINTPVIFSAYCFDEKYPELADKSLVLEMTEGTYDKGRENYDGIWQGEFRFRLTESGMDSHYEAFDSDILSSPMNLSFNGRFELTVNDYNDDGYPDFAVNQWDSLSGGTDCYLFTVKENGTVKSMDIKAGDRESPSLWLPKDYRGIYSPDLIMEGGNCFGVSFFTSGGVTENDIPLIPGGVIDEWFAEHEDRAVSEFTLKNIYMCEGESVTLKEQQILEGDGSIWYTSRIGEER